MNEGIAKSGTFRIGGTIDVHRLGYGAMQLTGKGVFGPPADRENAKRVLRRAMELGVDLIDTADSYGPDVNEELIAEALHPYPANLTIATKAGLVRPGPGQWVPNGRPDHLRERCEGSLRRLKLDRIPLFQLHRIDPNVPAEAQFETLAALRSEGKIEHIGLSEASVGDIERAKRFFPVATVQNRYNVKERKQWEDVVAYCEREGIAFLPWFPLGSGKLDRVAALGEVARKHRATPSQVALAWLLARSKVMIPIPGTASVAHLEENVGAGAIQLDAADMAALDLVADLSRV
ncbi:MAG TPA: aldo/keto reductase [Thermoanaerobaculia bacterium]